MPGAINGHQVTRDMMFFDSVFSTCVFCALAQSRFSGQLARLRVASKNERSPVRGTGPLSVLRYTADVDNERKKR